MKKETQKTHRPNNCDILHELIRALKL